MKQPLTLGVVIPTRNCAHLIGPALPALHAWLDLAAEVVVVDSFSTDGTLDLLKRELKHPNVRFFSHPPGLYQSWNFGISQLNTDYVNISTAGDTITRAGIQKLLDVATTTQCEVVISKPHIRSPQGEPADIDWPIDDVIRTMHITAPRQLHRREALVFACLNPGGALTGSCASNVFRTECLKRLPFPSGFGNAGDCAWCLTHVAEVSWAVIPEKFSVFLRHPTTSSQAETIAFAKAKPWSEVLAEGMAAWRKSGVVTEEDLIWIRWHDLGKALTEWHVVKRQFDVRRKQGWPWYLSPWAWQMRRRRKRWERYMQEIKLDMRLRAAGERGREEAGRITGKPAVTSQSVSEPV
jgi:hypothetical protein